MQLRYADSTRSKHSSNIDAGSENGKHSAEIRSCPAMYPSDASSGLERLIQIENDLERPQRRVVPWQGKCATSLEITRPVRFEGCFPYNCCTRFRKFRLFERGSAFEPACLACANFIAPHTVCCFISGKQSPLPGPCSRSCCLLVFSLSPSCLVAQQH